MRGGFAKILGEYEKFANHNFSIQLEPSVVVPDHPRQSTMLNMMKALIVQGKVDGDDLVFVDHSRILFHFPLTIRHFSGNALRC